MREFIKKYDLANWAIAFIAAFFLWLVAVSGDDSDISKSYIVPLQVTGQNALAATELNIINTLPEKVSIQVSGPPDKVNQLGEKNSVTNKISAKLDLSSIYQSGDYKLSYDVSFEVDSISVEHKSPAQISVSVDRIVKETFPVEIDFAGSVDQEFKLDGYELSVAEIEVSGPQRYIDEIARAAIKIDRTSLKNNSEIESEIVLYNFEDEVYTNAQIAQNHTTTVFSASLNKHKTVPLKVNTIITDDMITEDMVKVNIAPQQIEVWGDKEVIDQITEVSLGDVSIVKSIETGTFEYVLPVQLPEGVSADVTDLAAAVTIELTGLEELTVHVPNGLIPVTEGYDIVNTNGFDVVMYVKSEDADKIAAENLKLFPIYSQDEYDDGTLEHIDMRVVCVDYDAMIIGEYMIEVNKVVVEE
ncbi:MAG: hypothetical protein E7432_03685 [Ruminococcaceae bacterium]|nr:hypothetical protein [Oscillospiraceae bacterium]